MASLAKTIVATGVSSGLGFEAIKQLLEQTQPYKIILGARNTSTTQTAFDGLKFDSANAVSVLPLDLSDLKGVKSFAEKTLEKLGQNKIDYLLLNAGISNGAEKPGPHGSKWCEAYIVNHLSQHYLVHLLREKLVESRSRIVFVSSGAIRAVPDLSVLDNDLKGGSGATGKSIYPESKFVQFLGAHWWRRQLTGTNDVVAVSPGLIPGTGIGRGSGMTLTANMADAKSVPEGAKSILEALSRTDFPEDPDRIFLTSWGEWWEKSVYENSLDKSLQDKWSPSKEEIERDENVLS
jgi:NAD(P)-dependent dehydrogenase (short-subunit alcohol dehydrogenase family)